jgi:uncharacterized protein YifN (PemK superfamily)
MSNERDGVTIRYHPEPGDVFFCRFPAPGEHEYAPPEMIKTRRVVALSPRFRRHVPSTILVVPLSASPPSPVEPYHYKLVGSYPFLTAPESWAKGNMLGHVALSRLFQVYRHGKVANAALAPHDLQGIIRAVAQVLGIRHATR